MQYIAYHCNAKCIALQLHRTVCIALDYIILYVHYIVFLPCSYQAALLPVSSMQTGQWSWGGHRLARPMRPGGWPALRCRPRCRLSLVLDTAQTSLSRLVPRIHCTLKYKAVLRSQAYNDVRSSRAIAPLYLVVSKPKCRI